MKIIAEIGWNHMGDMSLAKKMIDSDSENGADICKFQTWSEKNLKSGFWDKDGRREIYKKAQLSHDQHLELKEYCAKKKVPIILSTGMSNEKEISNAVKIIKKISKKNLYLLHCISLYPTPLDFLHLRYIKTLKKKYSELSS